MPRSQGWLTPNEGNVVAFLGTEDGDYLKITLLCGELLIENRVGDDWDYTLHLPLIEFLAEVMEMTTKKES